MNGERENERVDGRSLVEWLDELVSNQDRTIERYV